MNWIRNNIEILIGYLLGLLFAAIGTFIIWNGRDIVRFKEIAVSKLHMAHFFDFINIYIYAFIKILSHYIHSYPILYGLFILLYGFGFIYMSRLLKRTTQYDGTIAYFYLFSAVFLFLFTAVLMFEVYDFFAIFYFIAFGILIFYVLNRKRLNNEYRKLHYIVLLFIFSLAYVLTQVRIYDSLESNSVTPLDVMALNFFFVLLSLMGVLALGNYIFLHRAKKVTLSEQKLSRMNRKKRDRQVSRIINEQTNEAFQHLSKQSLKIDERLMLTFKSMKQRLIKWIDLQDEDIPGWMHKPKWLKFYMIELIFGILMLVLTLIELNNRSSLFNLSKFNVVKMQYFYEWINLATMLLVIVLYLFFTLLIQWKNRGYIGQLITVTILFVKLLTSFYLMLFKGVNLSLFIPPVVILLVIMIIPLFVSHMRRSY